MSRLSRLAKRTLLSGGQSLSGEVSILSASRRFESNVLSKASNLPIETDGPRDASRAKLGIYWRIAKVVGTIMTLANGAGVAWGSYIVDNSILHSFWQFGPGCVVSIPKGLVMGATWPLTLANVAIRSKNWYLTDDPGWIFPLVFPYFSMIDAPMVSAYLLGFDSVVSRDKYDLEYICRKNVHLRAEQKERESPKAHEQNPQ